MCVFECVLGQNTWRSIDSCVHKWCRVMQATRTMTSYEEEEEYKFAIACDQTNVISFSHFTLCGMAMMLDIG